MVLYNLSKNKNFPPNKFDFSIKSNLLGGKISQRQVARKLVSTLQKPKVGLMAPRCAG